MNGGIEIVQTIESHSLYVQVNGTVEKFHCVFNKGLVLGVAYTGGIDRTAVMLGKSGKIVIDDGLVAVASCNGRLQIRLSGTIAAGAPSKYSMAFSHPLIRSSLRCDHTASQ